MEVDEHVFEEHDEENTENEKKIRITVLDTFKKLTHDKVKILVKNGGLLIRHLIENQHDEAGQIELRYALGRLIRGLGASKNSSKKGFYIVLVSLFNCLEEVNIEDVLDIVNKELHTSGGNSKSENADISAGQILFYGALIRTAIFTKVTRDQKKQMVEQLLSAGKKRSYLYFLAVMYLLELCKNMEEIEFKSIVWPLIMPEVSKPFSEHTIDSLYLLHGLRERFTNVVTGKFLKKNVGCSDIYADDNLANLANILINIPKIDIANHPIYDIISIPLSHTKICIRFVEEADRLLVKLNYNRHLVLTLVLTSLLKNLTDFSVMPQLLTKNYIRQTLGYFKTVKSSKNPEQLQQKIYGLFDAIIEGLKNENVSSETKIETLKKLIFYPGTFIFEKITRSKVVQQITAILNSDGVKVLAILYKDVVLSRSENNEEKQVWLNNDKVFASQLLVKLLGHPAIQGELDWKFEQLKFLLDLGLLKKENNIGVELGASLKDTFFGSLSVKLPKLEDVRHVLTKLVYHIEENLSFETNESILRNPLNPEAFETWSKSLELIKTLELKSKKKQLYPVFHTLFLHLSLQLFNDVKLAKDSLEELFNCYSRTNHKKTKDGEELEWIEVVIDLFLNLLSHNSYLLRNLVNCVFPHLCQHLNATAVHQILDVLDPENENNPLMEISDSENEDDKEVSEAESSSDSEMSVDNDETISDKLKQAVQNALGGYRTDEESVDLDEISDSEGKKLDDALALAFKQFKPNVGKKSKKQKKEDEALTHFRIRVLDLIDIYLDSEPSMFLCLEIMVPLLRLLEFSIKDVHQKPLLDRVRFNLRKMSTIKKFTGLEEMNETVLSELFGSLIKKSEQKTLIVQEMGDKIADCCIFIIRCSQYLWNSGQIRSKTKKHLKKNINAIAMEALESYFIRKESLAPYVLFRNIFQMTYDGNFILIPNVLQYIFSEIRPFRKTQALELAKIFFLNHRLLSGEIPEHFKETLSNFTENTTNLLKDLIENPGKAKERFIKGLFVLLTTIKRAPLNEINVDFEEIAELVKSYKSGVVFSTNDTKKAYGKLCASLGVNPNVVSKTNLVKLSNQEEINNVEREIKKESVKNKRDNLKNDKIENSNDIDNQIKNGNGKKEHVLKLKKETQKLRMDSLSTGLSFDFSNTNVDKIKNEEFESLETERKRQRDGKEIYKSGNQNGIYKRQNGVHESDSEVQPPTRKKKRKSVVT